VPPEEETHREGRKVNEPANNPPPTQRRVRPKWYWPTQAIAVGLMWGSMAVLLLQFYFAPDEFFRSPKTLLFAAMVACVGAVVWMFLADVRKPHR
jgi:hypothetical protein